MDENNSNNSGQQSESQDMSNQQDDLRNLKAEMQRKTSNLDDKLAQLNQKLQQLDLLGNNVQMQQPKQDNRPDPIMEPEAYEAYMERKLEAKMSQRLEAQQRQQADIAGLVNNFPELQDSNSELTQQAISIYNNLSPQEKQAPGAYKLAVQSAALELGILPKNKRQTAQNERSARDESDDIGARTSNTSRPPQKGGKTKIDDATLAFAQALGKDINDSKYLERLQKSASRDTWGKFKSKNEY